MIFRNVKIKSVKADLIKAELTFSLSTRMTADNEQTAKSIADSYTGTQNQAVDFSVEEHVFKSAEVGNVKSDLSKKEIAFNVSVTMTQDYEKTARYIASQFTGKERELVTISIDPHQLPLFDSIEVSVTQFRPDKQDRADSLANRVEKMHEPENVVAG